jgi:uncharacterized hydrophobic protein (TIGR00341 family)
MSLRLLEIIVPEEIARGILESIEAEDDPPPHWTTPLADGLAEVRIVLDMESLEGVTDHIEQRYRLGENSRILIHSLEAVIPRLIREDAEAEEAAPEEASEEDKKAEARRLHREELYSGLYDQAKLTRNHLLLVILSALVAAIGLLRNSESVLVGAMVIAPLLGPQLAMAFAASLGDMPLLRHAARTAATGMALALAATFCLGLVVTADPALPTFAHRTTPSLADLGLALAAGAAGTLCYTMGQGTAVVGVMVAVALMPPLAGAGLLAGNGDWARALGALALFAVNIIGINAAGIAVCLYQGVRPGTWWEQRQAARAAQWALALWLTLLATMAGLLWWRYGF